MASTYVQCRRKQVGFHEEVLQNMESHAGDSLKTVLNSKIEIMEQLRRQEASSSFLLQSQHSMLSRLCASVDPVDCVPTSFGDIEKQKRRAITESLRYPDMRLRKDTIPFTYRNTFDWIFSEQHRFRRWLESESGIFWISGKAGSGKSTLMKFVSEHASTRSMLATWAAPHEAHSLDFYFWYTGSELQKSQEGLLRSILHDIFTKCPDLLPKVVPHRWNSPDSFHRAPDTWSRVEMSQVLRKIAALDDLGCKLCLFLDGLDEFSGDHRALIADLRALCTNKSIKICVSSRPWNVFSSAFTTLDTVLHLEELTADDIYQYASGHLAPTDSRSLRPEVDDLISEIVLKSQGVFFWVFLVTRSLQDGLYEGDSIKILRRRLSEIPSDLEEFFESLLTRLDKIYKSETSQVLKLATVLLGQPLISMDNWLDFWLLRELDFSDRNFAAKMEARFYKDSQIARMKQDTARFINTTCRDFLSVCRGEETVEFLHRSAHEFLSSGKIRRLIDAQAPLVLQDPRILLHIRLARCKIMVSSNVSGDLVNRCFGRAAPPGTLDGSKDDDYVFTGSDYFAKAFEDVLQVLLDECVDERGVHHDRVCFFSAQWLEIYQFLIANGRYDTLLKITAFHKSDLFAGELLILTAHRFPRQPIVTHHGDKSTSAAKHYSAMSSDEFVEAFRACLGCKSEG